MLMGTCTVMEMFTELFICMCLFVSGSLVMGFITYVLVAGLALGTQNR